MSNLQGKRGLIEQSQDLCYNKSMITFICKKLARDKTLETMKKEGITTNHSFLNHESFIKALKQKLIEESQEVAEAPDRKELIKELADVSEVIDALVIKSGISDDEIKAVQAAIRQERGGFEKGIFLETISMADDCPSVKHFRKSPHRYIEI
jgi:predicted house-cleaning noncanonical NTP pyrophosphatase (MazG superfamily)